MESPKARKKTSHCEAGVQESFCRLIERSLEVKLPTIWTDEKKEQSQKRKSETRRELIKRRANQRKPKKEEVREKVGKSRNTVFFPLFCGSEGSRSRLAKAAGAKTGRQMKDEK